MTPHLPALGVRFDIDKVKGKFLFVSYGIGSCELLWRAVDTKQLTGTYLFAGDTAATLRGEERVFCIVAQGKLDVLRELRRNLTESQAFNEVAGSPPFRENDDVVSEPLLPGGKIDAAGTLILQLNDWPGFRIARKEVTGERGREDPEPLPSRSPARGATQVDSPSKQWWQFWRK